MTIEILTLLADVLGPTAVTALARLGLAELALLSAVTCARSQWDHPLAAWRGSLTRAVAFLVAIGTADAGFLGLAALFWALL